MSHISLGCAIRAVRKFRGMTQRAAASALGISAVHLCNVESGQSMPSCGLLAKMETLLDATLSFSVSEVQPSKAGSDDD